MKALCAGQLRHQVTLQSRTVSVASNGDPTSVWTTYATTWAVVEPLTGREYWESRATQSEVTHRVTLRHRSGVSPTDRVVYKSRNLDVVAVRNLEERDRILVLDCKESV